MNVNQTLHQANLSKWSALINEQQSSGLNIKQWCLETINPFTLFTTGSVYLRRSMLNLLFPILFELLREPFLNPIMDSSRTTCTTRAIIG